MTTAPQRLWHPFAAMADMPGREVVMARGEGAWVEDEQGRRYLDTLASLWYCNVGYGRAELVDAATRQLRELPGYFAFDVYANRPALALAERLAELAPIDDAVVFFGSGGSDAVDTAGKMVRRYWTLRGRPERTVIVAREGAYHGMHAYGTSLAGIPANAAGWGTLVPDVMHVPAHDAGALAELLDEHGERVAAFIGEPVIGAGGVLPPAEGYWAEVQRLCRRHEVLLIADEVVTGFGRLGPWFGCERFGIEPDLLTCAKGLTSGYLPLGAVLCGPRVRDVLWARDAGPFRHGYTYSAHPTACAVGLANLDLIERERLRERVVALEPVLAAAVATLADHPLVAETRNVGLLAAIELDAAARTHDPGLLDRLVAEVRARGVITRGVAGHSFQLSPPFVISEDEIDHAVAQIGAALDAAVLAAAGA